MCPCIYMYCMCKRWGCRQRKWHNHPLISHMHWLLVAMVTCSRLASEDGSVISSESVKEVSGKGSSVQKATAQQKLTKEEMRKSNGEKCLHSFSTFALVLSGHKTWNESSFFQNVLFSKRKYNHSISSQLKPSLLFLQLYQFNSVYWM